MRDEKVVKPDILDCLANLSSDEVFTPPKVVNAMLDMLPRELFRSPKTKFLDPFTKSGVFLREIAKRLDKGLETAIPDKDERIRHIFAEQVYGIAITQLTALFSRRSLYCNKDVNNKRSTVRNVFRSEGGNIGYRPCKHTWKNGSCTICGASRKALSESSEVENYAYPFLHDEVFMKQAQELGFDVVIGNPPYQLKDGGNGVSAAPIFQLFVNQAERLNPRYLCMIIPARWYAGGKGLDEFRERMLADRCIKVLVDHESSKDCFEGVNIAGGVCYFLRDREYSGDCIVINKGITDCSLKRALNEYPIFIRTNTAVSIVHKIEAQTTESLSQNIVYPRNPFGFATKERGSIKEMVDSVKLLSSEGFGFVRRKDVLKNADVISRYKVLIGRLVPSNGELDVNPADGYRVITDTNILGPNEITTESYLMIGAFRTKNEAVNYSKYIKGRFARFLLRASISSVNVTRECFRFVPVQDFSKPWTDAELYKKYKLTKDEIAFIESMIRPME